MEVGVLTQANSHMTTQSIGGYRPHTYEYASIKQVDVPTTYVLKQLIEGVFEGKNLCSG